MNTLPEEIKIHLIMVDVEDLKGKDIGLIVEKISHIYQAKFIHINNAPWLSLSR